MPHKQVILRTLMGSAVSVDRESGAILNVAVITVGKTKPSANGMDSFDIDRVSLQQVADAINASEVGVKSRMTHPEVSGEDDITRRVGYIRNARVEGQSVRADMYFHNPASDSAAVLFSIAETAPDSCGLSIVSNTAMLEKSESSPTGIVLRLSQIDAVDWVGEPAANPAGMLSAKLQRNTAMFTDQQMTFLKGVGLPEDATADSIPAFIESLDEDQKAAYAAIGDAAPASPDAATPPVEMNEEEETALMEDEDKAVLSEDEEKKPASMSAKSLKAQVSLALKAERGRMKQIRGIALKAGKDEAWINKQLDSDLDVGAIALSALNTLNRKPEDMQTSRTTVGADLNRDTINDAITHALLLKAGHNGIVKYDGNRVCLSATGKPEMAKPHERSADFRNFSPLEMGRRFLMAHGYHKALNMSRVELSSLLMSRTKLASALPGVFLAHSTGDFPFLLADSMGKVLRQDYALAQPTWPSWVRRTTAPDFKDIKKIQLSQAADLAVIPEGDEYEYGALSEAREVYALETQGRGLKFTRQMLINDDLSAFDRVPRLMAQACVRAEESAAIAILTANAALSDGIALFATGHANLTTGALTVNSLGAAKAALMKQTALGSDDPLELTPRVLLVPASIETVARQLVSSTVDPSKNNATPNPFANQVEVIPSARLDNNSATQWYLFADNNQIDTVEMAFLEGEESPVVEEEDEFDSDVRKVKVRHTFKPKAIDHRGMIRSSGA
jgi:hypothetical protein